MVKVHAEISEDKKRIEIFFSYDHATVNAIRTINGSRFYDRTQGGPYWTVPLDLETAQSLRDTFGKRLILGDELSSWGWRERRRSEQLTSLSAATDAKLPNLRERLPELHGFLRNYQRSGSAFVSEAEASLIADQPGLGKTVQVISGLFEAGVADGPNLIVAPLTSLESVWQYELERWQPYPVWVPTGSRASRESVVDDFHNYISEIDPKGWLVINPHMVAFRREAPLCPVCETAMSRLRGEAYHCAECNEYGHAELVQQYEKIGQISWRNIIIDECHKNAVRNPKTLTAKAMFKLSASDKRIAMSGTPIANHPIDLWGMLHFLHPEKFTSKWRWAGQYLEINDNGYGKTIGGVRPDRKDAFFKSLSPYVLRRTKGEVLKELPPKVHVDIWVEMNAKQAKQYRQFDENAWLKIAEEELTAQQIITEYLRLKQFAIAEQELRTEYDHKKDENKVVPYPTFNSCKLEAVAELLEERGIFDEDGTEKVVIFSQWTRVTDMILRWLAEKGVKTLSLTGGTKDRKAVQDTFQADGGPRVLVMTTETGGLAITLDRADSCIFIDETWTASAMEQAEDRLHRASRMHNVTVYTIRTRGTIDEYIMGMVGEKSETAEEIMDRRRQVMK